MDIKQTEVFSKWLQKLRDVRAKAAILVRIRRASFGNLGSIRSVGGGVSEMKIDVGQGYRAYFTIRQQTVLILLCGGSKSSQEADIKKAQEMAGKF
jgi:putative addiction module killer protein